MREYCFIHVFSRMSMYFLMYFPCFFFLLKCSYSSLFCGFLSPYLTSSRKAEKFENAVRALQEASEEQQNMEIFVHSGNLT